MHYDLVMHKQGDSNMPESLHGKGVISGVAMGKTMLVGQNLDGFLFRLYKA